METKCIRIRPAVGRTRSSEKKKESKMVNELPKTENTINLEINVTTIKKPWKKPVLLCGKNISFFGQMPPDPFPDS